MPPGIVLGTWAYALAQLTVLADRPTELLAGAALALLVALLAIHTGLVGAPRAARRAVALRATSRRRRVPRQVDPDAAG
ncbi:hypothetical protein GA0070616_1588 [Micromonospora nigra]|uniref:Uncharacterized protein n=1 Tax=Micromonospora nigra TaxID=145857 RepID=A0A1C6RNQ5_9ACTN|nr:hypothetical protein [Micromonospora nigra]SCL18776.1 hypothetical protein GA0070616_1588 [Micromonospora nigra]